MTMAKDNRKQFIDQRVEHEGNVWHFDGKYDPATKVLKVYAVRGDVTNPEAFNEAMEQFTNATGMRYEAK